MTPLFDPISIAKFRRKMGWTQEELGAEVGVSKKTISKWENGRSTPTPNTLHALRDVMKKNTQHITPKEGSRETIKPLKPVEIRIVNRSSHPEIKLCGGCKGKGYTNQSERISHRITGKKECVFCEGTGRIVEITKHSVTQQAFRGLK